jgi:hypothetical protein
MTSPNETAEQSTRKMRNFARALVLIWLFLSMCLLVSLTLFWSGGPAPIGFLAAIALIVIVSAVIP